MTDGVPRSYRIDRETEVHGYTLEPGTYPGVVSGNETDRQADGIYARHWLKIPGSSDQFDITKLVEDGVIEAL